MELQPQYEIFRDAGAEIVAVAVASDVVVETWKQNAGATYPVLADLHHRAAEAYHVYDLLGNSVAAPAAFVIREDGQITWAYIGRDSGDLPDVQTILDHLLGQ